MNRFSVLLSILLISTGFISCKKEVTVDRIVIQKDTVTDTVLITTPVRTDRYKGQARMDCLGGCAQLFDTDARLDAKYFKDDSTAYLLYSFNISGQRDTFRFSVVSGRFSTFNDEVDLLSVFGPDSLRASGVERPLRGLGTSTFYFQGKRQL